MLFQGEEYGERAPFQFFSDHIDPEIADATREGRRREFASFAEFCGRRGARPAGRRDLRALQAHPRRRARGAARAARRAAPRPPRAAAARRRRRRRLRRARRLAGRAPRRVHAAGQLRPRRRSTCRASAPRRSSWPPTSRRSSPASSSCPRCPERWCADGGLARSPVPARRDLGRRGDQLLDLLRARRARRAVPVRRRRRRRDVRRDDRAHVAELALLPARACTPASATASASTAPTTRRPGTASTRPSCCWTRTRSRSRARSCSTRATCTRTSRTGGEDDDLTPDDSDDAAAIPKCVVIDPRFDWQDDRPPNTPLADSVIYETHVKGFTMQHPDVREDLRGTYAGLAVRRRRRLPQGARRDRDRAAAGPPHRRRGVPRRPRADELLGLLDDRLPRPALALRRHRQGRPGGARVQGHGQGAAQGGDRGDPRRRLQPHRRGQPPRPDALLPRRRQRRLLPARARRPAPLHGLHGHRQHAQRHAPERAAADHGLAALLGDRLPRRRLPLRPRVRARPRALRRRPAVRVLRRHPSGPGALARSS